MTSPARQPASLADQVRQALASAAASGQKRPGRGKLASQLGVKPHQVRRALAEIGRQGSPARYPGPGSVITFPDRGEPTEEIPAVTLADSSPALTELTGPAGELADQTGDQASDQADQTGQTGQTGQAGATRAPVHRWWLIALALPAFVAVWGGWVGLGGLAGFGPVALLPGIADGFKVNLAVTLPAGMEIYAVIGLRVWLSHATGSDRTRRFAMWSSMAALAVGCFGQVVYHVLARPVNAAPLIVTVFVACLPVAILGAGAALFHLTGEDARQAGGQR